MARTKKEKPEDPREFILLDLRGNEINNGDEVVVAQGSSYSSWLSVGYLREIKKCPQTVRIYYSVAYNSGQYATYVGLAYEQSGKPSNQFLKLENIQFDIDKPNFARLLVAKADFKAKQQENK